MRIISRKHLNCFGGKHPTAKAPLDAWFHETKHAEWKSFADVRAIYGSADVVAGNRVIFNIGGNKFRLVVSIAYRTSTVYIKFIGTHKEYDAIDPTTIEIK